MDSSMGEKVHQQILEFADSRLVDRLFTCRLLGELDNFARS